MNYRLICPHCKKVINLENAACPECKKPISRPEGGILQVYRMGSPLGVANGFALYIDGEPMGHIGNKESLRMMLPYGEHNFHVACGMNRKCNDLKFTLSPQSPIVYCKVNMKPGFWTNSFNITPCQASEMPED